MKKYSLRFLFTVLVCSLLVISCSESGGGEDDVTNAISLGDTLNLSGTITKYFSSGGPTWGNGTGTAAAPYQLISTQGGINDGELVDSDGDGDANDDSFSFSTGVPVNTVAVEEWGFSSSVSGVKVYSAEIKDSNETRVQEFELSSEPAALWYEYVYASGDTVISGTAVDGGTTYIFDNVSVSQGWNKVISKTSDDVTYTYTGGTISGAVWTFMQD